MFSITVCACMYLLCDLISSEEKKAEDDSFETDLIAGRLEEEVVRMSSVLMGLISRWGHETLHTQPSLYFYRLLL